MLAQQLQANLNPPPPNFIILDPQKVKLLDIYSLDTANTQTTKTKREKICDYHCILLMLSPGYHPVEEAWFLSISTVWLGNKVLGQRYWNVPYVGMSSDSSPSSLLVNHFRGMYDSSCFSAGCQFCLVCVFRTVDWFRLVCTFCCRESLFLTRAMSQLLGWARPR